MDESEFRFRLRQRRRDLGLNQAQFGERIGLSRASFGLIEQGRRGVSLAEGWRLSEALGVNIDWLCGRTEKFVDYFADPEPPLEWNFSDWRIADDMWGVDEAVTR